MKYSPEVICFGEAMVEFNASTIGRLKDVTTFERGYGGDTSNTAVAVARLGTTSGYITKLGKDELGKCLLDLWYREEVETSQVLLDEEAFTAIYFVTRTWEGDHEFTYFRRGSAASYFKASDLNMEYIKTAKVFHTSGITQAISPSCRKTTFKVVEELKSEKTLFTYDPNIRLKLWSPKEARRTALKSISLADVVMLSMDDARIMFGKLSSQEVLEEILKLGPKIIAIKLGEKGCLVSDTKDTYKIPGLKVNFIDSTGAGDAFDAALIVGILEDMNIEKAAIFANTVGALKCMGKGAIKPLPRRKDVDSFLKAQRNI